MQGAAFGPLLSFRGRRPANLSEASYGAQHLSLSRTATHRDEGRRKAGPGRAVDIRQKANIILS